MHEKNNTLDLHKTLAHEIKAAKKYMFKLHRDGASLDSAVRAFVHDTHNRLNDVLESAGKAANEGKDLPVPPATFSVENTSRVAGATPTSDTGLADHILAIMNDPKCPDALYNKIAGFVTDCTNIKDSTGETLLDRWCYEPATINALCACAKEEDERKEIAEETMEKAKAAGGAQ